MNSPINNSQALQKEFVRLTKNDEVIQTRYMELASWQGVCNDEVKFLDYKMEGYLRKFVQEVRVFQKGVNPKRYFLIDYNTAKIKIFKKKPDNEQDSDATVL